MLVGAGITLHEALKAADALADDGIRARVIDCYSLKPVDADGLREAAAAAGDRVVTVEDHWPEGGLGDAVLGAFADADDRPRVVKLAVRDMPGSGKPDELLHAAGHRRRRDRVRGPRARARRRARLMAGQVDEITSERLRALAAARAPEGHRVLTIYFDLDPSRFATGEARRTEISSVIDEAERKARGDDASLPHDGKIKLRADVDRVREWFERDFSAKGTQGLALFACSPAGLFEVLRLPCPSPRRVAVDDAPLITPLAEVGPPTRWAVLLVDRRHGRLFAGTQWELDEVGDVYDRDPGAPGPACARAACPRTATSARSRRTPSTTSTRSPRPCSCGSSSGPSTGCWSRRPTPSTPRSSSACTRT